MPDSPNPPLPGIHTQEGRICFDYIKSPHFRVIHVEGAHGGPGPRGKLQMALYNERWPIPQKTTCLLDKEGRVGAEIRSERKERDAVIREVEVEIHMDLEVAETLARWLEQHIAVLKRNAQEEER